MIWSASGRLQLFWDSPILAGAVFAALAPWGYVLLGKRGARWIFSVVWGLVGIAGCTLTQSRGPMLALLTASVAGLLSYRRFALPRKFLWSSAVMGLVVATFSLGTASGERVRSSFTGEDASIGNRLLIWRSSLAICHVNPIHGVGSGEAGNFFSQWYQPESLHYRYTGIFNEYLQLGVEYGIPSLLAVLSGAISIVLVPFILHGRNAVDLEPPKLASMAFAAYLSLLVLMITGLFSILRESYSICVIILLNLAALAVYLTTQFNRSFVKLSLMRLVCLSLAIASTCVAAISLVGQKSQERLEISLMENNSVRVRKVAGRIDSSRSAAVFLDQELLGRLYGKEIRRWLLASDQFDEFRVFDPRYPVSPAQINGCSTLILIGRSGRFAQQIDAGRVKTLILIHPSPTQIALQSLKFPAKIYVPGICEDGTFHTLSDTQNSKLSFVSTGALSNSLLGLNLNLSP